MLGSLSSSSSAMADYYRRLLQRSPTEDGKTDVKTDAKTEERRAEERKAAEKKAEERKAEQRNQATEARNYLDDQGNPTNAAAAVSKAASGGDEERKAQLKEKLRMLVEQLKSLLQFAMRNPAMAKALAQLSREIASVAKQLGTSGPAVNVGAAQAAPAQAQAAPAQAATAQAAPAQAASAEAASAQAASQGAANAAAQGAEATQGAEAAAQPQSDAQPQPQAAAADTGTGQQAEKSTAEPSKEDDSSTEDDGAAAAEDGETEGLGSAEMAAARGQAILEKANGDRPKDESDPELKALLTLAKALTRQAKAIIEDMARDAQRSGKNDDFKEELKDASEAVKEIQKLDTGISSDGASAGAIVSLIA